VISTPVDGLKLLDCESKPCRDVEVKAKTSAPYKLEVKVVATGGNELKLPPIEINLICGPESVKITQP